MKNDQVRKALQQDEMGIVKNIESLLKELQAGAPGMDDPENQDPAMVAAAKAAKPAGSPEGAPEDTDDLGIDENLNADGSVKVKKDITSTASDAATANDDVDARIEEVLTEVNADNVAEVAKAARMIKALQAKKVVQKSAASTKQLHDITMVLKGLVDRQGQTETALANILEGLGVAGEIQKVAKSADPVVATDQTDLAKAILALAGGGIVRKDEGGESILTNGQKVHKNVGGIMEALGSMLPQTPFNRKGA